MMDDAIKKMVDDDIEKYSLAYKASIGDNLNDDEVKRLQTLEDDYMSLFFGMHSRYSSLINNFPDDISFEDMGGDDEMKEYRMVNYLKNVVEKLDTYRKMWYREVREEGSHNIIIHNENNNHNENNLSNTLLSFQDAKQKIENMSALTDNEIDEILQKINQLEDVANSSDRKSKKWDNAKGIIKWVADKSFDVAKIIIPLVLQIEQK